MDGSKDNGGVTFMCHKGNVELRVGESLLDHAKETLKLYELYCVVSCRTVSYRSVCLEIALGQRYQCLIHRWNGN